MEEIIEIVVSLIGLIFYWLLTSRKSAKKKKPKVQPPQTRRTRQREPEVTPEQEAEVYEPIEQEPFEEVPETEPQSPVTFEELLEQFTGGRSRKPVFEAPTEDNESDRTERIPKNLPQQEAYLDEYKPIIKGGEQLMQPGEHTGSILKKSIEEFDTPKISTPSLRSDGYKLKKRKVNKFTKLIRDKDSLKNALIMKEVLDRKYF